MLVSWHVKIEIKRPLQTRFPLPDSPPAQEIGVSWEGGESGRAAVLGGARVWEGLFLGGVKSWHANLGRTVSGVGRNLGVGETWERVTPGVKPGAG